MKLVNMIAMAAALFGQHALAATVDLGVASNYNVFVFDSYKSSGWSSIGGAVAVGGDANISSSSIANSAANAFGLVVGGNLTKTYGGINGTAWVGGAVTKPQWDSYSSYSSDSAPINFSAAKTSFAALSDSLAASSATGSVTYKYGSNGYLAGTGSNVEYFSLSGSDLTNISNWEFTNVLAGATLILNVSGSTINLSGGWSGFGNYNVLFNFYDATTVKLNNISFAASILAVDATITGNSGNVTGTVVANGWNNSLTLRNDPFTAFVVASSPVITSPVPEPAPLVLLLIGVAMMFAFRGYKHQISI